MTWGIKHAAIETVYKGAIMPLLMYGAPVWIEAMNHDYNRREYIRVQRLINISMAKAYGTTSSEALCMVTAMTPITVKLEETNDKHKQEDEHWTKGSGPRGGI